MCDVVGVLAAWLGAYTSLPTPSSGVRGPGPSGRPAEMHRAALAGVGARTPQPAAGACTSVSPLSSGRVPCLSASQSPFLKVGMRRPRWRCRVLGGVSGWAHARPGAWRAHSTRRRADPGHPVPAPRTFL